MLNIMPINVNFFWFNKNWIKFNYKKLDEPDEKLDLSKKSEYKDLIHN
jgi:hypothetical protein